MPCPERSPRPTRGSLRLALLIAASLAPRATADDARPPAASPLALPAPDGRHRIIPLPKIGRTSATSSTSTGGWWAGAAGVALVLAAFGGLSVAARRFGPRSESGPLRVVGRTSLSPKHSVYLLRAGDKILIVGTGPQGSPTLLGEMEPDAAEVARPVADRTASTSRLGWFQPGGRA